MTDDRATMQSDSLQTFHEVQPFRQWWLRLLLLVIAVPSWWAFVEQVVLGRPFGDNPGPDWLVALIVVLFGIAFPAMFLLMRLTTDVYPGDSLSLRLFPFPGRRIPLGEIQSAEAVTYQPLRDFGGWGIRWSKANGQAYNVSGDRGVQLVLSGGRRLLIGSQRPEELQAALWSAGVGTRPGAEAGQGPVRLVTGSEWRRGDDRA